MATAVAQKPLVRDSTSGVSERMVTLSSAVASVAGRDLPPVPHVPIEFDRGLITMAGPVFQSGGRPGGARADRLRNPLALRRPDRARPGDRPAFRRQRTA